VFESLVSHILKIDVTEYAPELAGVSDITWDTLLAFANTLSAESIGGGETGPLLRLARILLAAHYATISQRGTTGATGPVTSEAAGPVRRSYGLTALARADLSMGATGYGQQLMGLLAMSLANGPRLA
jgi:hypothetical protein